jgi:hypothetical protein
MQSHRRPLRVAFLSLGLLAACASRPHAAAGSSECSAKDGSKYDASSLTEVEARLQREGAQVAWDNAPEPYRPWAAAHLKRKLGRAAATLAESSNCREVEAASSKIKPLGKRIAEAAKKCDDAQCLAESKQPAPIDTDLELALCPLYPFC